MSEADINARAALGDAGSDDAKARRNAIVLAIGYAIGASVGPVMIASGGLVGHTLADNKALATLPIAGFILGTAASAYPAAMITRMLGRRGGYLIGGLWGIIASMVSAWAIFAGNFWLFFLGTFIMGGFWACVQSFRFAAADTASPVFRPKAISWVMSGGLAAAIIGPQVIIWTKDIYPQYLFAGSFFGTAGLCALTMVALAFVDIPRPRKQTREDGGRPLMQIAAQPRFAIAAMCGALSYGLMAFMMTATPLAMVGCGHTTTNAALAIQWHVLAMFGPSFVTGKLIARFGKSQVVMAGFALLALSAVTGLSGLSLAHFWSALILLGVGWNFAFIGATAMVTDCYEPEERNKVQGFNDALVFGFNTFASFASGLILASIGWQAVAIAMLPVIVLCVLALLWMMRMQTASSAA